MMEVLILKNLKDLEEFKGTVEKKIDAVGFNNLTDEEKDAVFFSEAKYRSRMRRKSYIPSNETLNELIEKQKRLRG